MDAVSVFEFDDYKHFLESRFQPGRRSGELKKLALHVGAHASRVLRMVRGDQHPSAEQAYLIAEYFQLQGREAAYFTTLVELARATKPAFKRHLQTKLKELRGAQGAPAEMVPLSRPLTVGEEAVFHSSPAYFLVWLASSVPGKNGLADISTSLAIPLGRTRAIAEFLVEVGFCRLESGRLESMARSYSLPMRSPQLAHFLSNWRVRAIDQAAQPRDRDILYTLPMAIGHQAFESIRSLLKQTIVASEKLMATESSEVVACLNIDLFELSK
jgi:hypothetical protein